MNGAASLRPGPPDGVEGIYLRLQKMPFRDHTWSSQYPELLARFGDWRSRDGQPFVAGTLRAGAVSPQHNVLSLNAAYNVTGRPPYDHWRPASFYQPSACGMFVLPTPFYPGAASFFNVACLGSPFGPGAFSAPLAATFVKMVYRRVFVFICFVGVYTALAPRSPPATGNSLACTPALSRRMRASS